LAFVSARKGRWEVPFDDVYVFPPSSSCEHRLMSGTVVILMSGKLSKHVSGDRNLSVLGTRRNCLHHRILGFMLERGRLGILKCSSSLQEDTCSKALIGRPSVV
jgi:hypothetical protein